MTDLGPDRFPRKRLERLEKHLDASNGFEVQALALGSHSKMVTETRVAGFAELLFAKRVGLAEREPQIP